MHLTRVGQRRSLALALGTLIAAGLILTGCAPASNPSSGKSQVVIAVAEEPTSLDACDDGNSGRSRILRGNVVEGLTNRDANSGKIEPVLATSWKSSDNKTWVFELRKGVKFQDGTTFNAAAVVDAMNRLFDPKLSCDNAADLFNPPTVDTKATGTYQVTFTLNQADPTFPLRMSFVHISSPKTPTDNKNDIAVGTGPYKITDWAHGDHITLQRFSGYWGSKPSIGSAKFVFRVDSAVRAGMVKTGEADLALGLSPTDVQQGQKDVQAFQDGETTYYRIDAESGAPLNDIRVREALNLATDRKGIIASAFGGYGKPAHEIFVPETLGYNDSLKDWAYDPTKAKQLVQEAAADGVDVSKEIVLYGRNGIYSGSDEVNQILVDAWTKIGLKVRIENLDSAAWGEVLLRPHKDGREPNILQSSHGNTTGDASFSVVSKYTCDGSQSASCDPDFDALVDKALTASDLTERDKLFQQAMAVEREDVVQDIDIAHMQEILQTSGHLKYTATTQSDFELLISDMKLTS